MRTHPVKRARALPIAALVAALLFSGIVPAPAQAQSEGQHHRAMVDIAATPSQQQDDEEGPDDRPSSPRPSGPLYGRSSMATAQHRDSTFVWGSAGHHTPETARKRVMDACAAAMGEGCVYGEAWSGEAAIAVAVDGGGDVWLQGGTQSKADAESRALKLCKEKGAQGCRIAFSFENIRIPAAASMNSDYSTDYFPKGPIRRRQWALLAWPETMPAPAWQRKAWLVSGRRNFVAARNEVLRRCRSDSGVSCTMGRAVADGTLAHYVNSRGQSNWIDAAGVATPAARVDRACETDARPCRVVALYDAATPRLQVVTDPEPTRGYVSAAWPAVAGNWHRLAIVTGRPTMAAANADAMALCERQSKTRCALYLDHPDNRAGMFLGLYSVPDDGLHIVFGLSIEHLKQAAIASCARNNMPCTNRAIVDLSKRGEMTPAWKD
ncbi:MAG: DUF4189 domain-containing protein [Pseudomonadota bacterium]